MLLRTHGSEPLHLQLYHQLREAVLSGRLQAGGRLLSTRAQAETIGVSRNVVLQELERRRAERLLPPPELLAIIDESHDRHGDENLWCQYKPALRECLQKLSQHASRLIDLRYAKLLSHREIGYRLNMQPHTAQVALSRIRAQLLNCVRRQTA